MNYDENYAKERIALLELGKLHGLNTVRFGSMKRLANILPHNQLVVVYFRPSIILTEIQWACQDFQNALGAEFVGNVEGPTTITRSIQIDRMSWGLVFRDIKGWKLKDQTPNIKWRGANREPVLPLNFYVTETINGRIVSIKIRNLGFRSLGAEGVKDSDYYSVEKELRQLALTRRKKSGIISNVVKENLKNISAVL